MARLTQRERIYQYLKRRGVKGATRRELAARLRILHQSVGPRVVELLATGRARETGEERKGCAVVVAR